MSGEAGTVVRRPRADWLAAAGVALAVASLGAAAVSRAAGGDAGTRWLVAAGAVMAYELWFLARSIARLPEEEPGALSLPNAVTVGRGLLVAATAGFVLVPPAGRLAWAPGVLYGTAAALDAVDGHLARRTGRTGPLGERLDLAFDTLGFLVAPLVAVAWGRLPVWYLSLSAARYAFRAGEAWRRARGRPVHPLPESQPRRWLAAFQMAFIAAALLPVLPAAWVHAAAPVALAPSLALFARDWLAVSGRLPRREE